MSAFQRYLAVPPNVEIPDASRKKEREYLKLNNSGSKPYRADWKVFLEPSSHQLSKDTWQTLLTLKFRLHVQKKEIEFLKLKNFGSKPCRVDWKAFSESSYCQLTKDTWQSLLTSKFRVQVEKRKENYRSSITPGQSLVERIGRHFWNPQVVSFPKISGSPS